MFMEPAYRPQVQTKALFPPDTYFTGVQDVSEPAHRVLCNTHTMKTLRKYADGRQEDSLSTKFRRKRFALFESLVSSLPRPLRILDVGGTQIFWETVGFTKEDNVEIVLLNLSKIDVTYPKFRSLVGDGRKMDEFRDKEFDIVFSNSVIEHVGEYDQQHEMAQEVRRVGKRYFIQTPSRFFPIEPHFLFPFFQFLPLRFKVFLIRHSEIGWFGRIPSEQGAERAVQSIRLLTERELRKLFPEARIYKEKVLGLTKSFVVYSGWQVDPLGTEEASLPPRAR